MKTQLSVALLISEYLGWLLLSSPPTNTREAIVAVCVGAQQPARFGKLGFWVGGLGSAVSTRNPQAANSLTKGGLVDARKDLRCSRRLLASAGNPSVVGASTALVRRLYWQFGEGRPQGCFFQSPRKLERLESYAIGPTGAVGLNGRLRVSSLQLLDSLPD